MTELLIFQAFKFTSHAAMVSKSPSFQKRMKPTPRSREEVAAGRVRILKAATHAPITHEQACIIGGFAQSWYHLESMRKNRLLKRMDYNTWKATPLGAALALAQTAGPLAVALTKARKGRKRKPAPSAAKLTIANALAST